MTHLADLKISPAQCQELLAIEAIAPLVLDGLKLFYLRQPQALVSFLFTELFLLFGGLIVVLPLVLVVANNQLDLDSVATSGALLQLTVGIALGVWGLLNGVLGWRAWRLRSLALLHHRIEQYNQLVTALEVVAAFPATGTPPTAEVTETLATLRTSLLGRIQLERLNRQHQNLLGQHQTLIAQLDQQLDALLQVETEDPNTEAARLLQEAVELGVTVHREVRQIGQKGKR
ncbi:MAG: hypothetical protein AAGG51_02500 [Cyanobacteria bacterium P01_G01_bin.54]